MHLIRPDVQMSNEPALNSSFLFPFLAINFGLPISLLNSVWWNLPEISRYVMLSSEFRLQFVDPCEVLFFPGLIRSHYWTQDSKWGIIFWHQRKFYGNLVLEQRCGDLLKPHPSPRLDITYGWYDLLNKCFDILQRNHWTWDQNDITGWSNPQNKQRICFLWPSTIQICSDVWIHGVHTTEEILEAVTRACQSNAV